MEGYYFPVCFVTLIMLMFSFATYAASEMRAFKVLVTILCICIGLLFLPTICYKETVFTESKLETSILNNAYYGIVNGKVINLNFEMNRNFSEKDVFYIKTEINKYKIFGNIKHEKVFVMENK